MKKLKDLIYDYNDILLAIIIIALAAGIIFWRVADIMAYPEYAKSKVKTKEGTEVSLDDVDLKQEDVLDMNTNPEDVTTDAAIGTTTGGAVSETEKEEGKTEETPVTPTPATTDTKVEIPSGSSTDKIAQIVYDKGLISSTKDFVNRAVELKVDTKLKAGTFTIPAGSDLDAILKILSK